MLEVVVFTIINGIVSFVSEALLADMAGLSEEQLAAKMKELGYSALLRISSLSGEADVPMLITYTRKIVRSSE